MSSRPQSISSAPPVVVPEAPSSGARVVLSFLAGRTAFGLSFLLGAARDLPIPWYRPLERSFTFGPRPGTGFVMEWYGRSLAAFCVASVVTAAVWLAAARPLLARALVRRTVVVAVARAAALALLVDFAYFGWILLHQTPHPLPLPPGCVP